MAIAVFVTTHAVLLRSGHSDPQARAAGEKRPISIEHRGRAIPNTLEEIVDPTHTAVIVHEMVRDIVAQYEPAQIERLLAPIQRILASAREKRVRIIYVRYTKHVTCDAVTRSRARSVKVCAGPLRAARPFQFDEQHGAAGNRVSVRSWLESDDRTRSAGGSARSGEVPRGTGGMTAE